MKNDERIARPLRQGKWLLWIGLPLCLITPLIFTQPLGLADFTSTGSIGDTIGGITAPFINILGAILVFLALKAQIEANTIIQEQINEQKEEKKLELESKQLNQLYSNLKESIDGFKFSSLDKWSIINLEGQLEKHHVWEGSEAFYKLFHDFYCDYHSDEEDMKSNPKICEIISMLEICESLLDRIDKSKVPDRSTLWTLTSHLFQYRIFPRMSVEYPIMNTHFCESCQTEHGLPKRLCELITEINEKLKNGLRQQIV